MVLTLTLWFDILTSNLYLSCDNRNVCINQRDAQILVSSLYFFVKWPYMFRTIISPSSGATFNKLYSATGTSGCCMAVAIQQPDVPACTNCTVQLIKCCSWWWTNDSPKHVRPFNEKIKTTHKNLCISLVYIHIAILCTVHTTSNCDNSVYLHT